MQFQVDDIVMKEKSFCCPGILTLKSRAEPASYPVRDLTALPTVILVFMIIPVTKNCEKNGTAV